MKASVTRILVAGFIALLPCLVFIPGAGAAPGKLKQQILPIDCVFQIVNDGSNTITYLTPEKCGVIINPPVSPPTTPTSPNPNGIPPSSGPLPFIPNPTQPQQVTVTAEQANQLPFQQVALLGNSEQVSASGTRDLSAAVPGVGTIIAVSAIGLIVLVIII
jgi:hypothetical protein